MFFSSFFFFFVNHFLSQSKGDKQHHVYEQHTKERYVSERMSGPAINYDHNLLKVIFYHLRDQLRTTINSNTQLDKHSSDYIITRVCLYCVQIQIESVEWRIQCFIWFVYMVKWYSYRKCDCKLAYHWMCCARISHWKIIIEIIWYRICISPIISNGIGVSRRRRCNSNYNRLTKPIGMYRNFSYSSSIHT